LATAGEEAALLALIGADQICSPLVVSIAKTLPTADPKYAMPSTTAAPEGASGK
jgi:hypothetical protein